MHRTVKILIIAWFTLELHELAHLVVYWLSGYEAWVSGSEMLAWVHRSRTATAFSADGKSLLS